MTSIFLRRHKSAHRLPRLAAALASLTLSACSTIGSAPALPTPLNQTAAVQWSLRSPLEPRTHEAIVQATHVRQAWVKAVAAQQSKHYAHQVLEAAQASAALAQRMEQAGNFSKLTRAREQLFMHDARKQLALAEQEALVRWEALVRVLKLTPAQASTLQLPSHLPPLPATPHSALGNTAYAKEIYGNYRTRYDIAQHYRDEVLPLQKLIAEENVLRYNGMGIGVFELLAEAREHIHSVMEAIEAEEQFWLADAALQAAQMGAPTNTERAE